MLINNRFYAQNRKAFVEIGEVSAACIMPNPQTQIENVIMFSVKNSQPMLFVYKTAKDADAAWVDYCEAIGDDIEIDKPNENIISLGKNKNDK